MSKLVKGFIAAPPQAFNADGSLSLETIDAQAKRLKESGVIGVFAVGTTGEGPILTVSERKAVAQKWREASRAAGLLCIVHVGSCVAEESRDLAAYAESIGADAVASVPPFYFKPGNVKSLVECLADTASACPNTPFYYYHIPCLTNVELSMRALLEEVDSTGVIPKFTGIKFTDYNMYDFGRCCSFKGGKYNMLFGRDECMLAGYALGADGCVGSTYNIGFVAKAALAAVAAGVATDEGRKHQAIIADIVALWDRFGGGSAPVKAMLKMTGLDLGPCRAPQKEYSAASYAALEAALKEMGLL